MHKYVITPVGKAIPLGEKTVFSCDPIRDSSMEEIGCAIFAQGSDGLYRISPKYLWKDNEYKNLDEAFEAAISWLWEFLSHFMDDNIRMINVDIDGWLDCK